MRSAMSADVGTSGNDSGLAALFVGLWFWVRGVPDYPAAIDRTGQTRVDDPSLRDDRPEV